MPEISTSRWTGPGSIDGGFQCCDAWQLQDCNLTPRTTTPCSQLSALTIGQNLRNHPSVLNFSWSDNSRPPSRRRSRCGASAADFQEPLIASAEYKSCPQLGPSGEKEGPYDWVPPSYWYDTTHYDPGDSEPHRRRRRLGVRQRGERRRTPSRRSTRSGASCRRASRTELWQNPDYNQYHLNYSPTCRTRNCGYAFGTLHDLDAAISQPLRRLDGLEPVRRRRPRCELRDERAEFEAYIDHSTHDARPPPPGVVYWSPTRAGRRCCGTSTTTTTTRPGATSARRRPTAAARPLYLRQRHRVGRQPRRRPSRRADGRGRGVRRRRHVLDDDRGR